MSGLAAREKPIIATDVGSIRSEYQAAPNAVGSQRSPLDGGHGKQRRESRRQPGGEFADAEKAHGDSGHPVIEHRLFEPRRAPQPRRNPIVRFGHGAGDRGVARLVRAYEAKRAQSAEQAHVEEEQE